MHSSTGSEATRLSAEPSIGTHISILGCLFFFQLSCTEPLVVGIHFRNINNQINVPEVIVMMVLLYNCWENHFTITNGKMVSFLPAFHIYWPTCEHGENNYPYSLIEMWTWRKQNVLVHVLSRSNLCINTRKKIQIHKLQDVIIDGPNDPIVWCCYRQRWAINMIWSPT